MGKRYNYQQPEPHLSLKNISERHFLQHIVEEYFYLIPNKQYTHNFSLFFSFSYFLCVFTVPVKVLSMIRHGLLTVNPHARNAYRRIRLFQNVLRTFLCFFFQEGVIIIIYLFFIRFSPGDPGGCSGRSPIRPSYTILFCIFNFPVGRQRKEIISHSIHKRQRLLWSDLRFTQAQCFFSSKVQL